MVSLSPEGWMALRWGPFPLHLIQRVSPGSLAFTLWLTTQGLADRKTKMEQSSHLAIRCLVGHFKWGLLNLDAISWSFSILYVEKRMWIYSLSYSFWLQYNTSINKIKACFPFLWKSAPRHPRASMVCPQGWRPRLLLPCGPAILCPQLPSLGPRQWLWPLLPIHLQAARMEKKEEKSSLLSI